MGASASSQSNAIRQAEPRDVTQIVSLEYAEHRGMPPSTDEEDLVKLLDDDCERGVRITVTDKVDACAVCFIGTTELYVKSISGNSTDKERILRFLVDSYGLVRIHIPPQPSETSRILSECGFSVDVNLSPPRIADQKEEYWTRCLMYASTR